MARTGSEFDVIVVGAGPAGFAAALALGKKGVKTLLLEQSMVPGENEVIGGILYGDPSRYGLTSLVPNFETEAPLERRIVSHELFILGRPDIKDGATRYRRLTQNSLSAKLGLLPLGFGTDHDFTLLRNRFDRWLAEKAVTGGATLSVGTTVEGLLKESGSVVGVRTAKEEIRSKLVIDASGVNSKLVEEAGLRPGLVPRWLYHAIAREFKLDGETIEKRFRTRPGEGRVISYTGEFTQGVRGWAFVQTNKDSLTVGLAVSLDSFIRRATEHFDQVGKVLDLEREFLANPMVAELLEGAEPIRFAAHNIPRGPHCMPKSPYTDGFMATGDALGAFVKIGPMMDGVRQAIASGAMAATAFLEARESGSFKSKNLSRYRVLLAPIYDDVSRSGRDSFVSESGFVYGYLPRIISASTMLSSTFRPKILASGSGSPATPQGSLESPRARKDGENCGFVPKVNVELGSHSVTKPWVPSCPVDCFTLVTEKGVFASFKELYEHNLALLSGSGIGEGNPRRKAFATTEDDIARARLAFDRNSCVGCGACGAIGPPKIVSSETKNHGKRGGLALG